MRTGRQSLPIRPYKPLRIRIELIPHHMDPQQRRILQKPLSQDLTILHQQRVVREVQVDQRLIHFEDALPLLSELVLDGRLQDMKQPFELRDFFVFCNRDFSKFFLLFGLFLVF